MRASNWLTSMAEVAFHRRRFLKNARITKTLTFDYQDFLADFSGVFNYLNQKEITSCLRPDPVPDCYLPGQELANSLPVCRIERHRLSECS